MSVAEDDVIKMSSADLYDWVCSHNCTISPLSEIKARVLEIVNPKNGKKAWLNLPISNTPVRDYTVYHVCNTLGIPIPTHATYMKPLHDKIQNDNVSKKRRLR